MPSRPQSLEIPTRSASAPAPGEPIPSHYRYCFGCGADHPTGLHMQMTAGADLTAVGRFTVTELHQGAPGLAHGGALASAIDDVLGGLNWLVGTPAVTGNLSVDYRRPVAVGQTLVISARIDGIQGRRVYTSADCFIDQLDGVMAVQATAVFIQVPIEHFTTFGNPEQVAQAIVDRKSGGPAWRGDGTPDDQWEVNP